MDKYYIEIELGRTNIKGSIFNNGLNVIYEQRLSTELIKGLNMYREGRLCRCGRSGCLGRYVSALGMVH